MSSVLQEYNKDYARYRSQYFIGNAKDSGVLSSFPSNLFLYL